GCEWTHKGGSCPDVEDIEQEGCAPRLSDRRQSSRALSKTRMKLSAILGASTRTPISRLRGAVSGGSADNQLKLVTANASSSQPKTLAWIRGRRTGRIVSPWRASSRVSSAPSTPERGLVVRP